MPTLEQVKKHYDKLTARERFALMVAAGARGDRAARRELADAAPTVSFIFPHVKGLSEGFETLTHHHIMQQLGTAGNFFMLLHLSEGQENEPITGESGQVYTAGDALTLTARRFMEGLTAYRAVCQEYDIDPDAMRAIYQQYEQLTAFAELVISQGFDVAELADIESTKEAYRKLIETSRERWAETLAR